MENIRDLDLLIDSRYPLVCIQTVEEARAEELVEKTARRMGLPLFTWTATRGLQRHGEPRPLYKTQGPREALDFIAASSMDAVYLLKDLPAFLEDALVRRRLRDIAQGFRRRRRSLVLTGTACELPPELEKHAARLELGLPDREELTALVRRVVRDIAARRRIRVDVDSQTGAALLNALAGLTLAEAEHLLTRAVLDDGCLDARDIPTLLEAKKEKVARSGVLEYWPRSESLDEVGGMSRLKEWLRARRGAFTEEARRFGLAPPRGLLLLGVQGCGKSLAAKAIAGGFGVPLVRLDFGTLYNK